MGKREPQLLRPAMGRLLQAKGRGEREKGRQGADRSPTYRRPHRILREPREVQERQTRQEHRYRRHVQATPHLALGIHPKAIQQGAVPLLLHRHYSKLPVGIHHLSGTAWHRKRQSGRSASVPPHVPSVGQLRQGRTPHVRRQSRHLRGGDREDGVGTIRVQSGQSEHHPPHGVHGPQPLLRAGTALPRPLSLQLLQRRHGERRCR